MQVGRRPADTRARSGCDRPLAPAAPIRLGELLGALLHRRRNALIGGGFVPASF
jgi:hypothetical protein